MNRREQKFHISLARDLARKRVPLANRLWAKVEKRGPDECWLWTGARDRHGYGRINAGGDKGPTVFAHRAAYELCVGEIPAGLSACHACDNPSCVNPKHIFLGKQADNMADCVRKGRGARGERNGQAKLTRIDVLAIRAAPGKLKDIGARFGISEAHVCGIKGGKFWRSAGS